jgi:hypothetical protein
MKRPWQQGGSKRTGQGVGLALSLALKESALVGAGCLTSAGDYDT